MNEPLLTINEAAAVLKVSRSKVYELIDNEQLPVIRLGDRTPRFKMDEIVEWLNNRSVPVTAVENQIEIDAKVEAVKVTDLVFHEFEWNNSLHPDKRNVLQAFFVQVLSGGESYVSWSLLCDDLGFKGDVELKRIQEVFAKYKENKRP